MIDWRHLHSILKRTPAGFLVVVEVRIRMTGHPLLGGFLVVVEVTSIDQVKELI